MKEEVINFEKLSDSRELLEAKEPNFMAIFIYIVLALLIAALAWMWFGEIDIVVKADGVVRPAQNVSIIRNVNGGNIKELNYEEGQKVEKGDILYIIDTESLDLKKKNLLKEKRKIKKEIDMLSRLERSIEKKKNLFAEDEIKYYNRYLAYKSKYEQLRLDYNQAQDRYIREKNLSFNSTTKSKLEKLKSEYNYAKLSMENYRSDTLVKIKEEIQKKKNRLMQLESQLEDVNEKIKLNRVEAPIAGTVQILQHFNQGDYMPSNTKVLRIIPTGGSNLKMEITIKNEDISQVEIGQQVNYRFLSLPYKEYGTLSGKIKEVASDATMRQQNSSLVYNAKGTIKGTKLYSNKGEPELIKIGMMSEARIVVRQKKIFYFVLEKLDFIS